MNKKARNIVLTVLLVMTMGIAAHGQIYLEGESSNRSSYQGDEIGIMPYHQVEHDQSNFVPLGTGILLLAALGGAYLLGNKMKKTNNRS